MSLQKRIGNVAQWRSVGVMSSLMMGFLFMTSMAWGQVTVTASVDRDAMEPTDTLVFSVSISSSDDVEIDGPKLPPLTDFEIINQWQSNEARASFVTPPGGGRPQWSSVQIFNYNYVLQPKREGVLKIDPVEVVAGGKTYYTKPISRIRVERGAGQGSPRPRQAPGGIQLPPGFDEEEEEDPFSQLLRRGVPSQGGTRTIPINPQDAFFIQVETDKTEAYVGEQITVSWYLYTRGQIRDLDTLKYPSLKGFWKEDIEIATHLNFTSEIVNNIPYKKALLASFALFPIKEGPATIDSYTAKCSVITALDPFGAMGFGKAYTFTKASQPVKVNVKPLPAEGRPADFTGAVGEFQVSARVEDRQAVAGQPFTLKIRMEGHGNAKMIDIPPFTPPEGLELYDTQKESKFFRNGTSYKEFSVLLIPRREGTFTIPSISVSVFDPDKKKYLTQATEPVTVFVGQGQAGPTKPGLGMDEGAKAKPAKPYEPKLMVDWDNDFHLSEAQRNLGLSGVFGLIFVALFLRARSEMGWGEKKKDLLRQYKARLRRVDGHIAKGDWRAVGTEMTNAAYFVLGQLSGTGGANVEMEKLLLKVPPSVRRELAEPLQKQMDVFQILSFAPEDVVGKLKEPEQLKKSVTEMSKLIERAVSLGLSSGQSGES